MRKDEIIRILEDWNFWKKELQCGIERRHYLEKIKKLAETNQIVAIMGARRSGKSFIMRQFAQDLMAKGVNIGRILIINFEDPRLEELDAKRLQEIYETYLEFLDPKEKPFIFLDEVQEVNEWEKWVLMMHELGKAKILISGSNAHLLGKELATLLTGRHLDLLCFPLSFREFLSFNKLNINDKLDKVSKRTEHNRMLRNYMEYGSFPEVVLSNEKNEILLRYFDDIINKDLIKRYKIRKGEGIRALARFYLTNIASPITFNSIEKFLGISADTIEKFSGYLEAAYLMFFLKRFSFKVKEQEKSPRKIYSIDTGLANTVGFRFSENLGKIMENIVFMELKRRQGLDINIEIFYWKDMHDHEVDFVLKEGLTVTGLIQVCWDITNQKTKDREIKALIKAMREFKINEGMVITENYSGEEIIEKRKISFISLIDWLLGE